MNPGEGGGGGGRGYPWAHSIQGTFASDLLHTHLPHLPRRNDDTGITTNCGLDNSVGIEHWVCNQEDTCSNPVLRHKFLRFFPMLEIICPRHVCKRHCFIYVIYVKAFSWYMVQQLYVLNKHMRMFLMLSKINNDYDLFSAINV